MSIITLNNRATNRSDTASSGQVFTATSATAADFQDASGGSNTPYFYGALQNSQTISRGTITKVAGMTLNEIDTDSAFDGTTFTVPSNKAGNYFIQGTVDVSFTSIGNDGQQVRCMLYKNGSLVKQNYYINTSNTTTRINVSSNMAIALSASDTIELYTRIYDSDSGDASLPDSNTSLFGFKLI
tara:strand:+ start:54 stop:605 length:552 start_codon:yes stop_codon:yes gene_type:complete